MAKNGNNGTGLAGVGKDYSWLQLLNPVSPLFGGGDRYPEFMAKMFSGNTRGAWLTSKAAADLLAFGLLGGGIRWLSHRKNLDELAESDDPASNIRTGLGTTFAVPLSGLPEQKPQKGVKKKAAYEVPYPPVIGHVTENVINTGVPVAAALIGLSIMYNKADKMADKESNAVLDAAIANKSKTVRRLMQARAQQARGTISDKDLDAALASVNNEENYVKTAKQSADPHPYVRGGVTALGLLAAAVGVAGGIGAYKYFSLANKNNIKYKAMQKGLKEYAKHKSLMTPITIAPTDADEYFRTIAGDTGEDQAEQLQIGEPTVRDMPEVTDSNRQLSITL